MGCLTYYWITETGSKGREFEKSVKRCYNVAIGLTQMTEGDG